MVRLLLGEIQPKRRQYLARLGTAVRIRFDHAAVGCTTFAGVAVVHWARSNGTAPVGSWETMWIAEQQQHDVVARSKRPAAPADLKRNRRWRRCASRNADKAYHAVAVVDGPVGCWAMQPLDQAAVVADMDRIDCDLSFKACNQLYAFLTRRTLLLLILLLLVG